MSVDPHSTAGPVPTDVTATHLLDGLRLRLATQVAPRRWRPPLQQLTDKVQRGVPLEDAVRQTLMVLELRVLFSEALKLREPTQFVLDALRTRATLQSSWGNFTATIAYPLILLVLAVAGGLLLSFELKSIIQWDMLDPETAQSALDQHQALVGGGMVVGWSAVTLLMLWLVGPAWAWTAVVGSLVIVGRPLRWIKLQEILLRCKLMVDQGVADAQLASAVARSFAASSQAFATMHVAQRVQAGMPLGAALSTTMLSDSLCQPALLLLDLPDGRFGEACEKSANLLGQLIRQRIRILTALMPIFVLLLVGSVLWATLSMYLNILVVLVRTFMYWM